MDQITPFQALERVDQGNKTAGNAPVRRRLLTILVAIGLLGALALGFRLGRSDQTLPGWMPEAVVTMLGAGARAPAPSGDVIYYRDPDGKPVWSAEPRKTDDGRDFIAVRASEDVTFEDKPTETAPSPTAAGAKRVMYYRNPMGLPDTSPVPKKDSMGMDYLPVYQGEEEDGSTIKISPGKLQRTGVRSEAATRRVIAIPVRAPGISQADERRLAVVSLRAESFIEKVENVTTGDRVRKGQPLLRLYSAEIAAASAQYLSVLGDGHASSGSNRSVMADGARRRLQNLNVPADVLTEIESSRKVPLTITWLAPTDGLVLERNVVDGMKAGSGDVLFRIVDDAVVWALADVPERELALVAENQTATVRVRGYPDRVFQGKISKIYPQLNAQTRTARLRVELANKDGLLRPDMYADVEVSTGSGGSVIAVPDSAVVDTGTRQIVIVDKGEGRFEPREVQVGARGQGLVEIREGVAEGDQLVVAANFLIDAESNLKAALRGFATQVAPK
jgi:membrane fusion protein, copper/silver efflux system